MDAGVDIGVDAGVDVGNVNNSGYVTISGRLCSM